MSHRNKVLGHLFVSILFGLESYPTHDLRAKSKIGSHNELDFSHLSVYTLI